MFIFFYFFSYKEISFEKYESVLLLKEQLENVESDSLHNNAISFLRKIDINNYLINDTLSLIKSSYLDHFLTYKEFYSIVYQIELIKIERDTLSFLETKEKLK